MTPGCLLCICDVVTTVPGDLQGLDDKPRHPMQSLGCCHAAARTLCMQLVANDRLLEPVNVQYIHTANNLGINTSQPAAAALLFSAESSTRKKGLDLGLSRCARCSRPQIMPPRLRFFSCAILNLSTRSFTAAAFFVMLERYIVSIASLYSCEGRRKQGVNSVL